MHHHDIIMIKLSKTVEAEIKVIMLPQRVWVRCEPDETQVIKWTAEGAVKSFG